MTPEPNNRLDRLLAGLPSWASTKEWLAHYFGGLYDRADRHHIFLLSGGLSFSLFICVVPLVLILFAALGQVLERSALQSEINLFIERMIPYQDTADSVKDFIQERLVEFRSHRKVAGFIGGIGLLFAASTLFSSLRTVLNRVYETEVTKHVLIGKLRDFGMVLMVLGYFLVSTTILPLLEIVKDSTHKIGFLSFLELGTIERLTFFVFSFLLIYSVFYVLYYLVPYEKLEKRIVAVSALWAAILWEIAKQAFGYYITQVATITAVYGTYVFLIVVGFWIYYTSIVFIAGAEIGQLYRERRDARRH